MITGKQLVDEYRKTIGKYNYDQRDCIGSIWKILEKYGAKTDLVGSNWFARHELRNMRPLTDRSQLFDGCAVLKTRLLGESGYDLPPRYISDADLIDYNHIGIGTDQGEILDSTRYMSGGIYVRNGPGVSTAGIGPNSWDIIGEFEDVDYTGMVYDVPGGDAMVGYINLPKDSNVKFRITPSTDSQWYGRINGGEAVEIVSDSGEWTRIRYGGNDGYVMSKFITTDASAQPDPMPPDVQDVDRAALIAEGRGLLKRLGAILDNL